MALERLRIADEEHLPFGHLHMRLGRTECGSRFWSIWPDGPIGKDLPRMIVNGFISDEIALAGELEAIAARIRTYREEPDV